MEIIFATQNENKLKEVRVFLKNHKIIGIDDIDIEIIEDGNTFYENALIKAKTIGEMTNKLTIADDSGIEIDFLDKKPGIHSARFLGVDTDYKEKNKKVLELMKDVEKEKRTARFICAMVAYFPDGKIISTEGVIEGEIYIKAVGVNGFGYDPIFYIKEEKMTLAEISPLRKNEISHRAKALKTMEIKLLEALSNGEDTGN